MFGVSFTELLLIGAVALMIVGPDRLPKMLGTLGRWSAKLRKITYEVRHQSGIDEILRNEGISGGLSELRQLRNVAKGSWKGLAGGGSKPAARTTPTTSPGPNSPTQIGGTPDDPFVDVPYDRSREYPGEGPDAYGALPDDLWNPSPPESRSAPDGSAQPAPDASTLSAAADTQTTVTPAPGSRPDTASSHSAQDANAPPATDTGSAGSPSAGSPSAGSPSASVSSPPISPPDASSKRQP